MMKLNKFLAACCTICLVCFGIADASGKVALKPDTIEYAKKASVGIHVNVSLATHSPSMNHVRQGVLVNKEKGLLLTNNFYIASAVIAEYDVVFYNGAQAKANLLYYDPHADYAFLKIDPVSIPEEATVAKICTKDPMVNEAVFTLRRDKSNTYTVHDGLVATLQYLNGFMSIQTLIVSAQAKTATSSCNGIFWNTKGELVAVSQNCYDTYSEALHPAYIRYAMKYLENDETPVRKHIGAVFTNYSLSNAVKFDALPLKDSKKYSAQYPKGQQEILRVTATFKGSPAAGKLLPGDIIWAAYGKLASPYLVDLDLIMNTTDKDSIELTVFRNGSFQQVTVPFYNPSAHKVTRMIQFGGAVFAELDDIGSRLIGLPAKQLAIGAARSNSIFNTIPSKISHNNELFFIINLLSLDQQKISSIDDLLALIPTLVEKKNFILDYISHYDLMRSSMYCLFGQDHYRANITYDANMGNPILFTWDAATLSWKSSPIALTKRIEKK